MQGEAKAERSPISNWAFAALIAGSGFGVHWWVENHSLMARIEADTKAREQAEASRLLADVAVSKHVVLLDTECPEGGSKPPKGLKVQTNPSTANPSYRIEATVKRVYQVGDTDVYCGPITGERVNENFTGVALIPEGPRTLVLDSQSNSSNS